MGFSESKIIVNNYIASTQVVNMIRHSFLQVFILWLRHIFFENTVPHTTIPFLWFGGRARVKNDSYFHELMTRAEQNLWNQHRQSTAYVSSRVSLRQYHPGRDTVQKWFSTPKLGDWGVQKWKMGQTATTYITPQEILDTGHFQNSFGRQTKHWSPVASTWTQFSSPL